MTCAWRTCGKKLDGRQTRFCSKKCALKFHVDKRRKELKRKAVAHLGGQCSRCGYSKCTEALQFHHRDSKEKEFTISDAGLTRSWAKLLAEIEKCDLLCANCHAEAHIAAVKPLVGGSIPPPANLARACVNHPGRASILFHEGIPLCHECVFRSPAKTCFCSNEGCAEAMRCLGPKDAAGSAIGEANKGFYNVGRGVVPKLSGLSLSDLEPKITLLEALQKHIDKQGKGRAK